MLTHETCRKKSITGQKSLEKKDVLAEKECESSQNQWVDHNDISIIEIYSVFQIMAWAPHKLY